MGGGRCLWMNRYMLGASLCDLLEIIGYIDF